jgi:DNA primase
MAGLFSPATLEQVRSASDIVDVIGGYLPLKRAGANFVALCPFHKEKSPSFNVNPSKQIFHCFGCHKGGDVFTFVKEYENVDFPEAVRRLAERARIPLQFEDGGTDAPQRHIKEQLLQVHEAIAQRWQTALRSDPGAQIARDYLAHRGVSDEAVQLFRIGYAPDAWDDTVNWARGRNFSPDLMEKSGLILRREGGQGYYDRFRGRLMFPICDEQGRVIGFSGRILSSDAKTAKYVNSPETPIFTKSKVFFGLDKSKRAILDAGFAIVCEGQLDLIACYMAGVKNIVAPQGTAFTGDHTRILRRYVEEIVLCFDSDEAGQNAAARSLDHLLASGLAVRVAQVPAPHDPDSYIKEFGGEAFQQLISGAQGFFDWYLKRLCATNDLATDKGRLAVLREMGAALHKTGNVVLIDTYSQKTAHRLGVSAQSVLAEFRKTVPAYAAPDPESFDELEAQQTAPPNMTERWLLKLLLSDERYIPWAVEHLRPEWIEHPGVRDIVNARFAAHEEGSFENLASFLDRLPGAHLAALVTETTADSKPLPNPERQLRDIVVRLRNQEIDRRMAGLVQRLHHPDTHEAERLEIVQEQALLRQEKKQPLEAPL